MAALDITRRGVLAAAAAIAAALALGAAAPDARAEACTPGAAGCGWQAGDLFTYTQDDWGAASTPAGAVLDARFNALYGAAGYVEVGTPGSGGRSVLITSASSVFTFLPSSGAPAQLNADLVDPTSTSSGLFGGDVLALRFNIDMSDAGSFPGAPGIRFGDLILCGVAPSGLDGMTVRAFQAVANDALGGGSTPSAVEALDALAQSVNAAFLDGAVTAFAQQHLFAATSCPRWRDGDMVTYGQEDWGETGSAGSALLTARWDGVYPNGVEVGLPGAAGSSAKLTGPDAVRDYLPAAGPAGPLDNDLLDPTSTSAGVLGGHALALQLDVDYADAGHLGGSVGLRFGDLRVCGLPSIPSLDGLRVRDALAAVNRALGEGGESHPYDALAALAHDLSESFASGSPSRFAQEHLVDAASCPGSQDGHLMTYIQGDWGTSTTPAGALLAAHHGSVYASTFGIVEVGVPGAPGRSMSFTAANPVFSYLPSSGLPAPLNADLVDPVTSSSGVFGGEVLALRLNVDFSDAGLTGGAPGRRFGDLTLCSPPAGPTGISVRAFLAVTQEMLGGGVTPFGIDALNGLAQDLNAAFVGGEPSAFAEEHLFDGACPVASEPRLEVTKETAVQQVGAGTPVSFTLTVRNTGTGAARNVVLRDDLAGLVVALGDLAPGGSATRTATVATTTAHCPTLTNVARATADNAAPAEASAQVAVVCPDTTPPACTIAEIGKDATGRAFTRFVVTDTGRGLKRHVIVYKFNAKVVVDAYAQGSHGPVSVLATAVDRTMSLGVTVDFYDLAGNRGSCDPIVYSVARVDDQPQDETFTGVPAAESRVTISNGDPGMRKVRLTVNGIRFKETRLRPGEVRRFDVASAMRPGDDNTVVVRARGKKGASALIVLADIP
jgi:uncharacterized repeat protein (TIGR01451 family)